jgi:hypothetical protein
MSGDDVKPEFYVDRSLVNGMPGVYRGVVCVERCFTTIGARFLAWRWNRYGRR